MKLRFLGVALLTAACSTPVFAIGESESPEQYCKDEARDAGITDKAELKAYIADCVQQIKEEMEEDKLLESDQNVRQRMGRDDGPDEPAEEEKPKKRN